MSVIIMSNLSQCKDDKKLLNARASQGLVNWSAFIADLGLENELRQQTWLGFIIF